MISSDGDATAAPLGADDLRRLGLDTMRSVVSAGFPRAGNSAPPDEGFGAELVELSLIDVWAMLWARDGLARRDRSLVTMGILIALGAEEELKNHVRIAVGNGMTESEIAEVIYHAAGYAGFPRAMAARKAARQALGDKPAYPSAQGES